jgi:tRNA 2-thiocytidine biosynthesis protein TtcA
VQGIVSARRFLPARPFIRDFVMDIAIQPSAANTEDLSSSPDHTGDDAMHPIFAKMPASVSFNKLRKRLLRQVRQAIEDFGMLNGQPNFPNHVLPDYLSSLGIKHRIEYRDTYSIVKEKVPAGGTYCALCSRLRRGNLYRIAREEGCEALVLGHHREDILETFFMNFFHGGRLATMPAKLLNDEGDLMVLRPLAYAAEDDLAKFAAAMEFPIIPCDLCGSQDGLERNAMKAMLSDIERRMPGRKDTMLRALGHVNPSHLLDPKLFDFQSLFAEPKA